MTGLLRVTKKFSSFSTRVSPVIATETNVVSPANDFANLWPAKISFRTGGFITGVIGILIQPWRLVSDPSGYIFTWLVGYSAVVFALLRATGHSPAKKPPKPAQKAKGSRHGSKTATVLELLKREGGVSSKELMKATGWQAHSVRGFISGHLVKRMGLKVNSTRRSGGQRSYHIIRG